MGFVQVIFWHKFDISVSYQQLWFSQFRWPLPLNYICDISWQWIYQTCLSPYTAKCSMMSKGMPSMSWILKITLWHQKIHHDNKYGKYIKEYAKYVMMSKSTSCHQGVCQVHHDVKKYIISSRSILFVLKFDHLSPYFTMCEWSQAYIFE